MIGYYKLNNFIIFIVHISILLLLIIMNIIIVLQIIN